MLVAPFVLGLRLPSWLFGFRLIARPNEPVLVAPFVLAICTSLVWTRSREGMEVELRPVETPPKSIAGQPEARNDIETLHSLCQLRFREITLFFVKSWGVQVPFSECWAWTQAPILWHAGGVNTTEIQEYVAKTWRDSITPELIEYIKIPALSPEFDADWQEHGQIDRAVAQVKAWCEKQPIADLTLEVVRVGERTPVLLMEIAPFKLQPQDAPTVLLYGHLDKQPEMKGWDEDKGPWKPVRVGDRLYGRGGADDGYAAYGSLTAIAALQRAGIPHGRCVVLIETCEESGSYDLPAYIDALGDRIGSPELVICLDSGCGNYEQLWSTTSLRGLVNGVLTVRVLDMGDESSPSGVHSGNGGGVIPSSFRILRQLIARLEDEATGAILVDALNIEIPEERVQQARAAAEALGEQLWSGFSWSGDTKPMASGHELVLNRTWRPCLEVVGMSGVPNLRGGNVLRAHTSAKLSVRLPPTVDGEEARKKIQALLEAAPPHGASVRYESEQGESGWNAPPVASWLDAALQEASQAVFGKPAIYMGEGGSIPFMGMLGEKFPKAQFVITGVLGPESNAHGPNEFIHLAYAEKVTCCIALILAQHCAR